MKLILFLYNCALLVGILLYPLVYILKRKFSWASYWARLSFFSLSENDGRPVIWIQVVSVGEAQAIRKLLRQLEEMGTYRIIISTTTLTGNRLAKKLYMPPAEVIFFPFDLGCIVRRALRKINPQLFIAVETELWPTLFFALKRHNIPVCIVNGRISDRAFRQYTKIVPLMRNLLSACTFIGVQDESYKERFLRLGTPREKLVVTGNMKFDTIEIQEDQLIDFRARYEGRLKNRQEMLLIAASTHYPEEEYILDVYRRLRKTHQLKLLIAPRHPRRTPDIVQLVAQKGFNACCISRLDACAPQPDEVFVLDTIGELLSFYSISDVCFVGGSLIPHGGHNILEPMFFGKPVVFGPHMDNFKEIETIALRANAALKVEDVHRLEHTLKALLRDETLRQDLGRACESVCNQERQELSRNLELIKKCLHKNQ